MSEAGLKAAQQKMRDAGVEPTAIEVFTSYYHQLEEGGTGLIREDTISPLTDPPMLSEVDVDEEAASAALDRTVIIKLNGGLGTSMGLDKAKSLLEVRDGRTFLDLIVGQVRAARKRHGARLPLLFMDSFNTRDDTLEALAAYPDLAVGDLPLDFLQNQEPKLRADDLTPVEWPADPALEWCPPGHGDLYTALLGSGLLDKLLEQGFRYASVSNGDNLGAVPDARLGGWFAASGAPYAAELCRRTVNDKKGGHLAIRKSDGQLILRDTAQTAPQEMDYFTDEFRHPFFHTNNLWFDLAAVKKVLDERHGVMGLQLIRNEKTVDPRDSESTPVIQVESAMGGAIEVFDGATCICVDRSRFLPVKTTNELLLLRSDVYSLDADSHLVKGTEKTCEIDLDKHFYKKIADFTSRIPQAPSLRDADRLSVSGDWTFGSGVVVDGSAELTTEAPATIPDGARLSGEITDGSL
ncbi:UTP--glucose-1-phosphate uridylyltransferase [Acidipropionibacterium acidipropionici]|uniref:UTP--glucose-1-phosphate uridylyltransferase n=1 Tax=Acidipropionibacterium acidipropionici TaxID=1748 RepID=A0AAC8YH22_9ACTN|nr:UTP--glucose-1-phosphate uridylyltransferase [Acidipropionibacterium acidipropionici]AMS06517.1 UTP--glucose-1-phosphate uridylyltransferase [Acidipropionibacterium acidipropionici]AOZ47962.1 UTP--glucose-1-phosphate uridylyltransferase [Acidipropionibacterium acidipropionici]AZP38688.1 UTP--glucose-1-phosphate uridylyltransferase [Acidipropionibacterium acidipropionici]